VKEDLKGGGRRRQERASACTMGGVDAFPPCEVESIEGLLKEAEDIKKCATLVSSLGQQVASCANSLHIMGENADASQRMVQGWVDLFVNPSATSKSTTGEAIVKRKVTIMCDTSPAAVGASTKRRRV